MGASICAVLSFFLSRVLISVSISDIQIYNESTFLTLPAVEVTSLTEKGSKDIRPPNNPLVHRATRGARALISTCVESSYTRGVQGEKLLLCLYIYICMNKHLHIYS